MSKYNRINHVIDSSVYGSECHLIMREESPDLGYGCGLDIDLNGGYAFNCDFKVLKVIKSTPINDVNDIYDYCEVNNIKLDESRMTEDGFLAGYEKDMLVKYNLSWDWLDDIE